MLDKDTIFRICRSKEFALRFWLHVDKSESCWIWRTLKTKKKPERYGTISLGGSGKYVYVHRASWIMHNGNIPDKFDVCHHCDNPPCVNPDHLFIGTRLDNVRDCISKKRDIRGSRHYMAKLNEDQVVKIRLRAAGGELQRLIAKDFGICRAGVSEIVNRKRWKHVI